MGEGKWEKRKKPEKVERKSDFKNPVSDGDLARSKENEEARIAAAREEAKKIKETREKIANLNEDPDGASKDGEDDEMADESYGLLEKEVSRRGLFGLAWKAALAGIGLKLSNADEIFKNILEYSENPEDYYKKYQERLQKQLEDKPLEVTSEQIEKEKNNDKTVKDILGYRTEGRIKYGVEQAKKQEDDWYEECSDEKKMKPRIRTAYGKIMSWMESDIEGEKNIEEIFQERFIEKIEKHRNIKFSEEEREDLFMTYIAQIIRESEGKPRANSPAGAGGMHQFMKGTVKGEKLDLQIYGNVDERYDPIKSAEAYADFMFKLYIRYDENLDLARIGYNGIVGSYYLQVQEEKKKGEKSEMNMKEFYEFVETDLNLTLDTVRDSEILLHVVKKDETAGTIAGYYGLDVGDLKNLNPHIKDIDNINPEDNIYLPGNEKTKPLYFKREIKKYIENTNYLPAISAIKKVLKEMKEADELPEAKNQIVVREHMKVKELGRNVKIKVKKGEGAMRLAENNNMTLERLVELNGLVKGKNGDYGLKKGQILFIERMYSPSMEDLSGGDYDLFDRLCLLNPKVKDPQKPLPIGTVIRI